MSYPYKIWNPATDSTSSYVAGQSAELENGYYQIQIELVEDDKVSFNYFDLIKNGTNSTDTIFVQSARFYGPDYLHASASEFKFYCCGKLCNGLVADKDLNGTIRFKGEFKEGIPTSSLEYYNASGESIRKDIYKNGLLKKIR